MDAASHAWPHPHPCPLPSRGREYARTGSPNDYLTDALDTVRQRLLERLQEILPVQRFE